MDENTEPPAEVAHLIRLAWCLADTYFDALLWGALARLIPLRAVRDRADRTIGRYLEIRAEVLALGSRRWPS